VDKMKKLTEEQKTAVRVLLELQAELMIHTRNGWRIKKIEQILTALGFDLSVEHEVYFL